MKRHSSSSLKKVSNDTQDYIGDTKVRSTGALWGIIIVLVILLILTTIIGFVLISESGDTTAKESETQNESLQQVSGLSSGVRTQNPLSVPSFPE